jgi:hypothetical protein
LLLLKFFCKWGTITIPQDLAIQELYNLNEFSVWLPMDLKSTKVGICCSYPVRLYYTRRITSGCVVSTRLLQLIDNDIELVFRDDMEECLELELDLSTKGCPNHQQLQLPITNLRLFTAPVERGNGSCKWEMHSPIYG